MKKRLTYVLLVMLATTSPVLAEKVYKHVAPDGTVVYSDEPSEGATEMVLPKPQTFTLPKSNKAFQHHGANQESEQESLSYTIAITEPNDEYTVPMGQETLDVAVDVSPALAEHHGVQLFFDAQPLGQPSKKTTFILTQLYRGTHTLQAKIVELDAPSKVLQTSETITFYVHRATVNTP